MRDWTFSRITVVGLVQDRYNHQRTAEATEREARERALREQTIGRYGDVTVEDPNRVHKPVILMTQSNKKIRYGCYPRNCAELLLCNLLDADIERGKL